MDRLALDGDGIGRLTSGEAAFVPYTLADETVSTRLLFQKKNHSRWLPESIDNPSSNRITAPCPYHFHPGRTGLWCGGCNWQMAPIKVQEESKRQLVVETLERLGGLEKPVVNPTVSSPAEWRYRNKVQVPFGRRGKKTIAGFYAPGSHEIVEFGDCLVQSPLSVELVSFVKEFANHHHWPAYDEDARRGWIRHLLIRTNEKQEALVALVSASEGFRDKGLFINEIRKKFPTVIGLHQNIQPARTNVILGRKWISLWGRTHISEKVLGLDIFYSAGSFFQVNKGAAECLYTKAIQELNLRPESVVVDLYCGVGALTLLAAKHARRAVGVEPVRSAIFDAKENARRNNVRHCEFMEMDAETYLKRGDRPSHVLLDPPRSGCSLEVIQGLLKLRPERVVYISCHPATLARDLKLLSSAYRVGTVTPVDLFPQTSHIETVTGLQRIS